MTVCIHNYIHYNMLNFKALALQKPGLFSFGRQVPLPCGRSTLAVSGRASGQAGGQTLQAMTASTIPHSGG